MAIGIWIMAGLTSKVTILNQIMQNIEQHL